MRLERNTLALAAFVSRPQAEAQIGANRIEIYNVIRSLSIQNVGWTERSEVQRLDNLLGFAAAQPNLHIKQHVYAPFAWNGQ